jgi:hypothetical protein
MIFFVDSSTVWQQFSGFLFSAVLNRVFQVKTITNTAEIIAIKRAIHTSKRSWFEALKNIQLNE